MGPLLFLLDVSHVSKTLVAHRLNSVCLTSLFSFFLDSVLSIATNADDKTLLFEIVFCIVWIGGAVIAVNG